MARGVEASAGIRREASPGQKQSLATPAAAETGSSMMLVTITFFIIRTSEHGKCTWYLIKWTAFLFYKKEINIIFLIIKIKNNLIILNLLYLKNFRLIAYQVNLFS